MKTTFHFILLLLLPVIATGDTLQVVNEHRGKRSLVTQLSKIPAYTLPAVLVGYGFSSLDKGISRRADLRIRNEILEDGLAFSTRIDDKLQYAPVAAVYALNMAGIKGRSNFFDRTAMYLLTNAVSSFAVDFLKDKTGKLRPSGHDRRSFPSGHTANAFASAEFMRQEMNEVSPWYGYLGYAMAGTTGSFRMINNHHWFSDVLAGAGIGILSTKLTYAVYPVLKRKLLKNKEPRVIAMPLVQRDVVGMSAVLPLN